MDVKLYLIRHITKFFFVISTEEQKNEWLDVILSMDIETFKQIEVTEIVMSDYDEISNCFLI